MINIKKGSHTLLVSKKTFESMFKPLGYVIIEEAPKKASSQDNVNVVENVENKKSEDLPKEEENISNEELKDVKNDSEGKEEDKKEEVLEEDKDKKENSLENILGMLSKEDNNKSKKK